MPVIYKYTGLAPTVISRLTGQCLSIAFFFGNEIWDTGRSTHLQVAM